MGCRSPPWRAGRVTLQLRCDRQEKPVAESQLATFAPFTAPMTGEKPFELLGRPAKYTVLYFYPKDNTPGCTTESIAFREAYPEFQALGADIYGLSRDSLRSHENFKSKLGLPFELISDADEAVCTQFDVMKMKNMYGKQVRGVERSTFVVDAQGRLVKEWRGVKVADHVDEVLEFVKSQP